MTLVLTIATILLAVAMIPQSAPQESPPMVMILPPAYLAQGSAATTTTPPTTTTTITSPPTTTTTTITSPPTTTTTATPECRMQNGTLIPGLLPGNSKLLGEGCGDCVCSDQGVALCTHPSCPKVVCWDSVINGPDCCPVCPNGGNCRSPQGTIVQEDESIMEEGENCTCTCLKYDNSSEGPVTECVPPSPPSTSTTTASPLCRFENGSTSALRKLGERWRSANGCQVCKCFHATGKVKCKTKKCRTLTCNFPQTRKDKCCAMCPEDLHLCVIDANTTLPVKETRTLANKTRCSCTFNEERSVVLDCKTLTPEEEAKEQAEIDDLKEEIKMLQDKLDEQGKFSLSEKSRFRKRKRKLEKKLAKAENVLQ